MFWLSYSNFFDCIKYFGWLTFIQCIYLVRYCDYPISPYYLVTGTTTEKRLIKKNLKHSEWDTTNNVLNTCIKLRLHLNIIFVDGFRKICTFFWNFNLSNKLSLFVILLTFLLLTIIVCHWGTQIVGSKRCFWYLITRIHK